MIDWFSGLVGYDSSHIVNGRVVKISPAGEIIWDSVTWEEATGSHDSNMQIKKDTSSIDMLKAGLKLGFLCSTQCLRLSGNPAKFLQGHNILGPSVSRLGSVIQAVSRRLPSHLRPLDCDSEVLPSVMRSRVDITVMVDLDDHQTVHDWLSHAALETRSRHGRAQQSGGTVYWGKNSTRWALKAYCKYCELKKHPPQYPVSDEVMEWTRKLLRIELVLRRPELKNRGVLDESILWEFMKRVEIGIMKINVKNLDSTGLSSRFKDVFRVWLNGSDVKSDRPKETFYKQRRKILDEVGVDISLTPTEQISNLKSLGFNRNLFNINVLRSKIAKDCPDSLQKSLF